MKKIDEIRRQNLNILFELSKSGTRAAFAEMCDVDPSQMSGYMNGRRKIGEDVARRVEAALKKGDGWLDVNRDGLPLSLGTEQASTNGARYQARVIDVRHSGAIARDGELHLTSLSAERLLALCSDPDGYAVRVDGDALSPLPTDGQVLVIEPNTKPPAGRLVLATHTDGTVRLLTYLYDQGERTYLQHPHRTGPQISYRKSELAKLELVAQVLNR